MKEEERNKNALNLSTTPDDAAFMAADFPEPKWLVDKIVPWPALMAIVGKPGSYKTWLAMWLARRITANMPLVNHAESQTFFSMQAVDNMGIGALFIEEEMNEALVQQRLKSLYQYPEHQSRLFWAIGKGINLQNQEHIHQLQTFVAENGIGLIFLDPFTSVTKMQDENSNSEAANIMDSLRKNFVDSALSCSIVFLHHPAKGDETGDDVRGAGDILGKCDLVLSMKKKDNTSGQILIKYVKNRMSRTMTDFWLELRETKPNQMEFVYLGTDEAIQEQQKPDWNTRVLEHLTIEWQAKSSILAAVRAQYGKAPMQDLETALNALTATNRATAAIVGQMKQYKKLP